MPAWQWLLVGVGVTVLVYAAFVVAMVALGRRTDARALATFIPDCLVLFRGLLRDPRVPTHRKLLLAALVVYLASPIDLIPDFIPVAGQLDDAILVAFVLRSILAAAGPGVVREHWRGPERSLDVLMRFASGRSNGAPAPAPEGPVA
jgi:uncharacterized membrane protein YkvA (DUF1232 family)